MGRRAEELCDELKTLAERLGLKVREETLLREVGYHTRSGICRVKGEEILFVDRTLPVGDRVEVLVEELSQRDLQGIYVSPVLRRLLEGRAEGGNAGVDGEQGVTTGDPEGSGEATQAGAVGTGEERV